MKKKEKLRKNFKKNLYKHLFPKKCSLVYINFYFYKIVLTIKDLKKYTLILIVKAKIKCKKKK